MGWERSTRSRARSTRRLAELQDLLFFTTVGLLATHELDAMTNHEWRVLPLTSFMSDEIGRRVFVLGHMPLFALLAWIAAQGGGSVAAFAFSAFAILHVGLHRVFRTHPKYEFRGPISRFLIWGPGVFAAGHLLVSAFGWNFA